MSDYENESFASEKSQGNNGAPDALYNLKLSVDIQSVKNMKVSANAFVKYTLNLSTGSGSTKT